MTRAVVVVESMFGNTEKIARAVADGIASNFQVEVVRVDRAPRKLAPDVHLLVVGGPTHAFGLSRPGTRLAARDQGADPSVNVGLREWLGTLRSGSNRVAVATFDTRIKKTGVPGSAARGALRRLRRLGFRPAAAPCSFYVAGTDGPLLSGEVARARAWATQLAEQETTAQQQGALP
jgi:hypothetical protein